MGIWLPLAVHQGPRCALTSVTQWKSKTFLPSESRVRILPGVRWLVGCLAQWEPSYAVHKDITRNS